VTSCPFLSLSPTYPHNPTNHSPPTKEKGFWIITALPNTVLTLNPPSLTWTLILPSPSTSAQLSIPWLANLFPCASTPHPQNWLLILLHIHPTHPSQWSSKSIIDASETNHLWNIKLQTALTMCHQVNPWPGASKPIEVLMNNQLWTVKLQISPNKSLVKRVSSVNPCSQIQCS